MRVDRRVWALFQTRLVERGHGDSLAEWAAFQLVNMNGFA